MEREHGVDRVKAVATLCVIAIHCQPPFFADRAEFLVRFAPLFTEWAVPAFFFLGGYVRSQTTPYSRGTTGRWLVRLLPAYVIASVAALSVRRFVFGEPVSATEAARALAIGSAWNFYYFVPLFLGALLFSHVLTHWPRSVPWLCALSTVCLVLTRWKPELDPFWRAAGFDGIWRSPFFWWGYFLAGWVARRWLDDARVRAGVLVPSTIVASICVLAMLEGVPALAQALARVGASIAIPVSLLVWSARPLGVVPALVAAHSYEIYLFHAFAIEVARHLGFWGQHLHAALALWVIALMSGLLAGLVMKRMLNRTAPAIA